MIARVVLLHASDVYRNMFQKKSDSISFGEIMMYVYGIISNLEVVYARRMVSFQTLK
jgi:hypothetical protein